MVARRRSAPLSDRPNTRVRRDTRDREARPRATGERATRRWPAWLLLAVLLFATLAAYQPAWRGGVLWDDDAHITRSELRSIDGLRRIWLEMDATQQYYPLVHSTFWLLHRLSGDSTLGYHLVSIGLHALAAFLLAVILGRLSVPWPWLAAMIFALHPVHVESVAWIAELKNTQSGVLFLASALAYLHFDESRRKRAYGLAISLFVLALLSKTVTATLPALLLVVLWWRRGQVNLRRDVLPLVPFLILGAAFGALTTWTERTLIGAQGTGFDLTLVDRCLIAGRAVWFYLGKLCWPADLTFIYPRWQVNAQVWWQYLYPIGVVALLTGLWLWRRRSPAPLAAVLFFCGALVPALGFINVYPFRYSFVADHFQYLASIGIVALFSGSVATLLERWRRDSQWTPAAAAAVIVVPLAFLTWSQSHDYANAETLYRATIARNPASWMAHNNLAVLQLTTAPDEAMAHIREALKYKPDYPEAHNNLGVALQSVGRFEEAAAEHAAALRLEPAFADAHINLGTALQNMGRLPEAAAEYAQALGLRPNSFQGHANLGSVLQEMGRFVEAIPQYREALRLDPTLPNVRFNLAVVLQATGRLNEAITEYEAALRIEPESADAHAGLGVVLEKVGRVNEAIGHYEAGVRLQPDSAPTVLSLANALYRTGDWPRAAVAYDAAIRLDPGSGIVHNNFGACLERLGRLEEAVVQYQETVRLLPQSADARTNLARATALLGQRRAR